MCAVSVSFEPPLVIFASPPHPPPHSREAGAGNPARNRPVTLDYDFDIVSGGAAVGGEVVVLPEKGELFTAHEWAGQGRDVDVGPSARDRIRLRFTADEHVTQTASTQGKSLGRCFQDV